jgi:hypothetical protein
MVAEPGAMSPFGENATEPTNDRMLVFGPATCRSTGPRISLYEELVLSRSWLAYGDGSRAYARWISRAVDQTLASLLCAAGKMPPSALQWDFVMTMWDCVAWDEDSAP